MLSDERIGELWVDIHKGKFMHAEFNTFARAVEAAVLAEKQKPVKDEPVAWRFSKGTITKLDSCPHGGNWQPLYIHPQRVCVCGLQGETK